MDDTIKVKDDPLVSEENWLLHFQSLHSNEPLNPTQQLICSGAPRAQSPMGKEKW